MSLHFVWDTLIVRDMIGKAKITDVAAAVAKPHYATSKSGRRAWLRTGANESRGLAYSAAYLSVARAQGLQDHFKDAADGPPPHLTQNYVKQATSDHQSWAGTKSRSLSHAGRRL